MIQVPGAFVCVVAYYFKGMPQYLNDTVARVYEEWIMNKFMILRRSNPLL